LATRCAVRRTAAGSSRRTRRRWNSASATRCAAAARCRTSASSRSFRRSRRSRNGFGVDPDAESNISALRVDAHLFRNTLNEAVRIRGFSAFRLLRDFADGVDVKPILSFFAARGANLARVWPYVTWPGTGWETPSNDQIVDCVRFLRTQNVYTYLTLFTDTQPGTPNRIDWAKALVASCQEVGLDSILFEIGNEPQINKHIDTRALQATLDASGFLYTSGEYDELPVHVAVVLIGTNNLGTGQTPQQTADGVHAVLDDVLARWPHCRVLLLAIFPRGVQPDDPLRLQVAQTNALLRDVANRDRVTWLDFGGVFLALGAFGALGVTCGLGRST